MNRNTLYLLLAIFLSLQVVACNNCGARLKQATVHAPKVLMLTNAGEWSGLPSQAYHFGPGPYHLIGQNEKGLFYAQEQINRYAVTVTTTTTTSTGTGPVTYANHSGVCVPVSAIGANPILTRQVWGGMPAVLSPLGSYREAKPWRLFDMPKPGILKPAR